MSLITLSLLEHPDIEKRLRQETYDIVSQAGRPAYDHMHEMKLMRTFLNGTYLQSCIDQKLGIQDFLRQRY